jgi:hypothetical protein
MSFLRYFCSFLDILNHLQRQMSYKKTKRRSHDLIAEPEHTSVESFIHSSIYIHSIALEIRQ